MLQTQSYFSVSGSAESSNACDVEIIFDRPSVEVVEIALFALQGAGVELVEWDVLLRMRMGVPRLLHDFSYLVPDDRLEDACNILESIGLPLYPPSDLVLKSQGDLYVRGHFYRITRSTQPFFINRIYLYPYPLAAFSRSELSEQRPFHLSSSRYSNILVPRPSAVRAFIIRTMARYPQYCYTRRVLDNELGELILYFFLGYTLHNLPKGEEEVWQWEDEDRRIAAASNIVKQWCMDREWRQGEKWIGDALASVVTGGDTGDFPTVADTQNRQLW
ncbi:hypothetical protein AZE42_01387 [Rhizopogon vesiculosus]|uniref:Uncharacterized protein n=1 Tax=Rhizopogon vesiculosus TaxID=180088 RepID=A0A1J8Q8M6_9AGAM|nr:hypothetical protein AZE42_01387 [Rhizopogon vesiculosus]